MQYAIQLHNIQILFFILVFNKINTNCLFYQLNKTYIILDIVLIQVNINIRIIIHFDFMFNVIILEFRFLLSLATNRITMELI